MACTQISTSVSILNSGLCGFIGVSLTNYTTSGLSAIATGSCLEVAGAFFKWGTDETPNASSWTAISTSSTAYLQCTPSGTAESQIITSSWTATAPTWSESKQGWYASAASNVRVIGGVWKQSITTQTTKFLYNKGIDNIFSAVYPIGDWNMDATGTLYVSTNIQSKTARNLQVLIYPDESLFNFIIPLNGIIRDNGGTLSSVGGSMCFYVASVGGALSNCTVQLDRISGGIFDNAQFTATSYNRGYIYLDYSPI